MGNMSYCRFENTVRDLSDCQDALELLLVGDLAPLSHLELERAKDLVSICNMIVDCVKDHSGYSDEEFRSKMEDCSEKVINQVLSAANMHTRDKDD